MFGWFIFDRQDISWESIFRATSSMHGLLITLTATCSGEQNTLYKLDSHETSQFKSTAFCWSFTQFISCKFVFTLNTTWVLSMRCWTSCTAIFVWAIWVKDHGSFGSFLSFLQNTNYSSMCKSSVTLACISTWLPWLWATGPLIKLAKLRPGPAWMSHEVLKVVMRCQTNEQRNETYVISWRAKLRGHSQKEIDDS